MKIIFFSDIHGNKYAFDAFLAKIENLAHDKIIFLGDVFGYYYYADYIINKLREYNIECLLGNHDKMLLDSIDNLIDTKPLVLKYGSVYKTAKNDISKENIGFLRGLSPFKTFTENNHKFGLFHGSPINPLNGRIYPDAEITDQDGFNDFDYCILGHTHHKMVKLYKNTTIINPGSLGQQRDCNGCSFILFDTNTFKYDFFVVDYNVSTLIQDIYKYDNEDIHHKLIEVLTRKK